MPLTDYRCVIACINANGDPDFFFCKVRCTPQQYENGDHLDRARALAEHEDYEGPFVVFDEDDMRSRPTFLLDHFVWESATTVTVGEED